MFGLHLKQTTRVSVLCKWLLKESDSLSRTRRVSHLGLSVPPSVSVLSCPIKIKTAEKNLNSNLLQMNRKTFWLLILQLHNLDTVNEGHRRANSCFKNLNIQSTILMLAHWWGDILGQSSTIFVTIIEEQTFKQTKCSHPI